jgi:glycosyltransferase involved in cell wall biosynthesis
MIDLTVVVPARGEAALAAPLLPPLAAALAAVGCRAELLVVQEPGEPPVLVPAGVPARVIVAPRPGYGEALQAGFEAAAGAWVFTLDADTADAAAIATTLWARRLDADVVIGSRYVTGGDARMPPVRAGLSRALNAVFGRGLSLGVRDLSSGMRLYRAAAIRTLRDLPP